MKIYYITGMTSLKTVLCGYVETEKNKKNNWKIEKQQTCGLGSGGETISFPPIAHQRILSEKIVC